MKKQIVQVSLLQSAKVMAGIYLITTIPIALIMALIAMATGQGLGGLFMAVFMSLMYAVCGFLFTLLGGWIYNLVAARVGGFEFKTVEVGGD
jgi:uncharacterized membrane protein YwaF